MHNLLVMAALARGIVLDAAGEPIPDVKITVESTVFHASYVHTRTDASGRYRVEVPSGGWKVHAQMTRDYHGKTYFFDLAPDDAQPFTGSSGAVRNFTWRIAGPRPELSGGHYGAQLTVYRGDHETPYELSDLEVKLVPDGPLIDGTRGRTLVAHPKVGPDQVDDIPVGRYTVSVSHPTLGAMVVRPRNRGDYGPNATVLFTAPYPESSRFGLEIEVRVRSAE
jgi:hypothetical protein